MELKERNYYIALYDIYKNLLTDKQKSYFEDYYYLDLSLAEIASDNNISRNAVFDQIKKVVANLIEFEKELNVYTKNERLKEFSNKLSDNLKKELLDIIEE